MDLKELVDWLRTLGARVHVTPGDDALVLREGERIESFEHLLPAPARIRACPTFERTEDLIGYVQRYNQDVTEHMVLFANPKRLTISAPIDWHEADGDASHVEHVPVCVLKHSDQFEKWRTANKHLFNQDEFVEFIDEQAPDIKEPDPATFYEIARTLRAQRETNFASEVRVANGDVNFQYTTETRGTAKRGELSIPEHFVISVPVFQYDAPLEIQARFLWRVGERGLKLGFSIVHLDRIERLRFEVHADGVAAALNRPAWYGHR